MLTCSWPCPPRATSVPARCVQEELATLLSSSPWWKRSGGRDHVIPLHHPCALDNVRDWMSGAMFVVVDFAR